MAKQPLVTTTKAAAALGVNPATLWRWQQAGRIAPAWVTPGGHARWDMDTLRRQLGAQSVQGKEGGGVSDDLPVVAAVVTSARGVLVGQRRDGSPPWTLIAGETVAGETPADTAVREVREETGLHVAPGEEIGRRVHPVTGRTMIYVAAQPADGASDDVAVVDDYELTDVRWASLDEASRLLPGLYEPVHRHLVSRLGAPPVDGVGVSRESGDINRA